MVNYMPREEAIAELAKHPFTRNASLEMARRWADAADRNATEGMDKGYAIVHMGGGYAVEINGRWI